MAQPLSLVAGRCCEWHRLRPGSGRDRRSISITPPCMGPQHPQHPGTALGGVEEQHKGHRGALGYGEKGEPSCGAGEQLWGW